MTRPRAGAITGVPISPAMSIPEWNWRSPVKGEMRGPKREVSQPLVGQIAGDETR